MANIASLTLASRALRVVPGLVGVRRSIHLLLALGCRLKQPKPNGDDSYAPQQPAHQEDRTQVAPDQFPFVFSGPRAEPRPASRTFDKPVQARSQKAAPGQMPDGENL